MPVTGTLSIRAHRAGSLYQDLYHRFGYAVASRFMPCNRISKLQIPNVVVQFESPPLRQIKNVPLTAR